MNIRCLQCTLLSTGFQHDVVLQIDATGDGRSWSLRGISIQPHVKPGYAGCNRAELASLPLPVADDASILASRIVAQFPEEAFVIPAAPVGVKGVPYPGQPELTDQDVLRAASAAGLAPEAKAALAAQACSLSLSHHGCIREISNAVGTLQMEAAGVSPTEPPKSFFQQYWHLIVPGE
jgi:hypothetical protein